MDSGTWGPDGPPDEAYSRVTDPERYLGFHAVADRVVADLVARYVVEPVPVEVVSHWRGGVLRAVELRPDGGGAPLRMVVTGFGVVLRAGHAYELGLPMCGCDACDEDPTELAHDLVDVAEAIAAGGLTETRRRRRLGSDPFSIELRLADGSRSQSGTVDPGDGRDGIPMGATHWVAWPSRARTR